MFHDENTFKNITHLKNKKKKKKKKKKQKPKSSIQKASILQCSAFFMVQLSHPYVTTRKTIAFTTRPFVSKVMSLLSNILSRFVIAFLSRSKRLLISWLQSPSTVILEPKKRKSLIPSTFSPSICDEVVGLNAMILDFLMLNFKPVFFTLLLYSHQKTL